MSQVLMTTTGNLVDLPWHAYLRALDDPKLLDGVAPPKLTPERRALLLTHLRRFGETAVQWRTAALLCRREMRALGTPLTVASAADLPPEPPPGGLRIVRP